MNSSRKMNRREFIKDASLAGLGLAAGPALLDLSARKSSAQAGMSKVVIVSRPDSVDGLRINADAAQILVDSAIMEFTGQATVGDAWASVLTDFSPDDVVSIKVNCINRSLPTHPPVADAIAAGLIAAGVKDNNIIIWDRTNHELTNCGYKRNTSNTGVRCFGSNEGGWGYDKQVTLGNRTSRLAKILTSSDHLINACVLKDHGSSGITLGMKNHYGSVNNPGSLHGGQCDPYVAELSNVPEIKDKTRLTVIDGLVGIYRGGPGGAPQFAYNSVVMGQDTVAVDYQGWKILEAERKKHNMAMPKPRQLTTAANLGLGTDDPASIELVTLELEAPEKPEEEPEEEVQKAVNPAGSYKTQWGRIKTAR